MARKLTAVDLFCGAGGLSEGLRQARFEVLGAIDVNKLACAAYRANHKKVTLWEMDIRCLSGAMMMSALNIQPGELSLLAACPPCQGFSTMRTKNGGRRNRDRRNDLIFEALRIARSITPLSLIIHNVPGLASDLRFLTFHNGLHAPVYRLNCLLR